jgi:hypothetical protein
MSKKASNQKPEKMTRPKPPPAPPRPYSDPVVEDIIAGLNELKEYVKGQKKLKKTKVTKACRHLNSYWTVDGSPYCPDCKKPITMEEHLPTESKGRTLKGQIPDILQTSSDLSGEPMRLYFGEKEKTKDYLRLVTEGDGKPEKDLIEIAPEVKKNILL